MALLCCCTPPARTHLPRRYDVCCISDLKQRFFSPAPAFFARARHRRRQGTFADILTDSRPTRLYSPWPSRLTRLFLSSDFTSGPFFFILSQRTFNFELCYFFFHPFHFYLCERSLLYTRAHARTHTKTPLQCAIGFAAAITVIRRYTRGGDAL